MALGFSFKQLCFKCDAKGTYWEFKRFKQRVEFTFKKSLTKADKKDCLGWLGMRIGQLGLEVYKTF